MLELEEHAQFLAIQISKLKSFFDRDIACLAYSEQIVS